MKQKRNILFLCLLMLTTLTLSMPAYAKGKRKLKMTLESVQTNVETYNPSIGEKLKITGILSAQKVKKADRFTLTVVVKNAAGKKVFKKSKTITGKTIRAKGGTVLCNIKWNGKTTVNGKTKVAPGGEYKVTATLKCTRAKNAVTPKKATASTSLTVDNTVLYYDPVSGDVIPRYTGYAEIDYLAELMLQEAGVKLDMPEEMRVRLIYNYMTVHFRHLQDTSKVVPPYDVTALASEIAAFKAETKKKVAAKQITYSNKWSGELNHFAKQAGTCNNNAAAFAILCNHAGIKCKRIWGQVRNGSALMNHYWNSAVVDGVTWYYDIDVEIHHYNGSGVSAFTQYRKTLEQSKKSHVYV